MGLRELYLYQLAEKEKEEKRTQMQMEGDVLLNPYDVADIETSENKEDETEAEQLESSSKESVAEDSIITTEQSVKPEQPKESEKTEESASGLKSVFENSEVPLDMFKMNEVLDGIVKAETPEVPADLSARLEEERDPEKPIKQINEINQSFDSDERELAKSLELESSSSESPEIAPALEHDGEGPVEIAPQVVELLGKDFDFDALLNKEPKTESNPAEKPNTIEEPIPAHEIGLGIYQAEGGMLTTDRTLLERLSAEQETVPSFPENMTQVTVIEPDVVAQKFNFVEESLPMFVRKKKKEKH